MTVTCMAWCKLVHMQGSCKGRDVHGSFMPTAADGDGLAGTVGELELTCRGALRVTRSGETGTACAFGRVGRQRGRKSGSSWGQSDWMTVTVE